MIKHEKIPLVWKISNIVPIPKGSNSTSPSNYRPISLLSVVSKVLEKIIYNRVAKNLESLCPPPSNQWGFLPQRSTTSAFIKVTDDWLTQLEEGNEVAAIFFDIKKAFDSVPHQHLLQKLADINLDPFLIAWISDYLTDRKQCTVLNGSISRSLPVTSGVPQG